VCKTGRENHIVIHGELDHMWGVSGLIYFKELSKWLPEITDYQLKRWDNGDEM